MVCESLKMNTPAVKIPKLPYVFAIFLLVISCGMNNDEEMLPIPTKITVTDVQIEFISDSTRSGIPWDENRPDVFIRGTVAPGRIGTISDTIFEFDPAVDQHQLIRPIEIDTATEVFWLRIMEYDTPGEVPPPFAGSTTMHWMTFFNPYSRDDRLSLAQRDVHVVESRDEFRMRITVEREF